MTSPIAAFFIDTALLLLFKLGGTYSAIHFVCTGEPSLSYDIFPMNL